MGIKKGKIGLEGIPIKEFFINVIEYNNNLHRMLRLYGVVGRNQATSMIKVKLINSKVVSEEVWEFR